jgi:hypothetical protein
MRHWILSAPAALSVIAQKLPVNGQLYQVAAVPFFDWRKGRRGSHIAEMFRCSNKRVRNGAQLPLLASSSPYYFVD